MKKKTLGLGYTRTEVWQVKEKRSHKTKLQNMLELKGISYISTPRPNHRGGGCAITCNDNRFTMKEIVVENLHNLEVTLALVRPKVEESNLQIITCAVYCPPKSKKNNKMIDFIS